VSGKGGRALGEEDPEIPGSAPKEADQHGRPPRPEQLAGCGDGRGGSHSWGWVVRGGTRPVESQALDERLHVHADAVLHLHGRGSWDRSMGSVEPSGDLGVSSQSFLIEKKSSCRFKMSDIKA
jgi:hypothetical protein